MELINKKISLRGRRKQGERKGEGKSVSYSFFSFRRMVHRFVIPISNNGIKFSALKYRERLNSRVFDFVVFFPSRKSRN